MSKICYKNIQGKFLRNGLHVLSCSLKSSKIFLDMSLITTVETLFLWNIKNRYFVVIQSMDLFSTLLSPVFWPKIHVLCVFGRNRVYGHTDAFSKYHFFGFMGFQNKYFKNNSKSIFNDLILFLREKVKC